MATISRHDLVTRIGSPALDPTGEAIGIVHEVFDDATGAPEWIGISTDLPGAGLRAVPVDGAEAVRDTVQVPHGLEAVRDSPPVRGPHVSPATERALRRYYGLPAPDTSPDDESTDEWEVPVEEPDTP
jgi:hypothetical protein